ncbi:MAG: SemiSWEET transporter [Coleofasciculaceae cyanobacterium SM2_1_6]|nr:SemiSWEET transporter [Coleofasciculaceae cyanobacterium SM2_1_6]
MDFVTAIGLCAGTLTTIAFLPQVIKTWRSRSAGDISLSMLIMFLVGLCLWLLYGIYLQAPPVIISNFVTILLNLVILWFKLKYK